MNLKCKSRTAGSQMEVCCGEEKPSLKRCHSVLGEGHRLLVGVRLEAREHQCLALVLGSQGDSLAHDEGMSSKVDIEIEHCRINLGLFLQNNRLVLTELWMVLPESCLHEGGEGGLVITDDPEANGPEERVRMGSTLVPSSSVLTDSKHMLLK